MTYQEIVSFIFESFVIVSHGPEDLGFLPSGHSRCSGLTVPVGSNAGFEVPLKALLLPQIQADQLGFRSIAV